MGYQAGADPPTADEMEILAPLIKAQEHGRYPITATDPVEAIRHGFRRPTPPAAAPIEKGPVLWAEQVCWASGSHQ